MTTLAKIHVGDLATYIRVNFKESDITDTNVVLDISTQTSMKITFIDPEGNKIGPFSLTGFVTNGHDGAAFYITADSPNPSLWTKSGFWKWWGTVTIPGSGTFNTNDVIREILGDPNFIEQANFTEQGQTQELEINEST